MEKHSPFFSDRLGIGEEGLVKAFYVLEIGPVEIAEFFQTKILSGRTLQPARGLTAKSRPTKTSSEVLALYPNLAIAGNLTDYSQRAQRRVASSIVIVIYNLIHSRMQDRNFTFLTPGLGKICGPFAGRPGQALFRFNLATSGLKLALPIRVMRK